MSCYEGNNKKTDVFDDAVAGLCPGVRQGRWCGCWSLAGEQHEHFASQVFSAAEFCHVNSELDILVIKTNLTLELPVPRRR